MCCASAALPPLPQKNSVPPAVHRLLHHRQRRARAQAPIASATLVGQRRQTRAEPRAKLLSNVVAHVLSGLRWFQERAPRRRIARGRGGRASRAAVVGIVAAPPRTRTSPARRRSSRSSADSRPVDRTREQLAQAAPRRHRRTAAPHHRAARRAAHRQRVVDSRGKPRRRRARDARAASRASVTRRARSAPTPAPWRTRRRSATRREFRPAPCAAFRRHDRRPPPRCP